MRFLFVYDAIKFKKDTESNLYTEGSINEEMWERYTNISSELYIISRIENKQYNKENARNSFNTFNPANKELIIVPDLASNIADFLNLNSRKEFNEIIEEQVRKSDFIIARVPSSAAYKAIKYAKKHKKPYLVEIVGCTWDALWNHSIKGKVVAPYRFLKMKNVVREANYVVYVTNEFLQRRYPTTGKSVNCSNVSLTEFDEIVLGNRLSKINEMKSASKIVIGTTAAVNVRYKGQKYIIEALGKLKEKGITNIEYQLVGGGDKAYLKTIATKFNVSDQVKFLGLLPHDNVFGWLDSLDAYVQPSRQEGLPRALIEAMSRGLPAFGAKTAGIPELLENEYIFSNTKNNISEICSILHGFTKEKMLQQAKRNYNKAKKYDKKIIEERRKNFFQQFINNEQQ